MVVSSVARGDTKIAVTVRQATARSLNAISRVISLWRVA